MKIEEQPYDDRHREPVYLDSAVNVQTVTAPREDPLRAAVKDAVARLAALDAEDSEDVHNVRCEVIEALVRAL